MKGWTRIVLFVIYLHRATASVLKTDCTIPPSDVSHLVFKPDLPWYQLHYDMNVRVVMSCDKGMHLVNSYDNTYIDRNELSAVCIPPGRWDITVRDFVCSDLAPIYCTISDKLIGLRSEQQVARFFAGDRITFFCIEGYQMSGPTSARCESSGEIYPEPPVCIPLCKLPSYDGLIVKPQQDLYATGEEIELSCEDGYLISGRRKRVCETSGTFFPVVRPTICTKIGCPAPGIIPHGTYTPVKAYYDFRDRIDYTCDFGYTMIGKSWRICHESNKFVWAVPRCVVLYCDAPKLIPNAYFRDELRESYAVGDTVVFVCKDGYRIRGQYDSITCLLDPDEKSASFSERPVCEAMYCEKPQPLMHGEYVEVKERYAVDEEVRYACNMGYVLEGPETATCLRLSGTAVVRFTTPPTCKPNQCKSPSRIKNGGFRQVQQYYAIGDSVKYFCKPGFVLEGEEIATCIIDENGMHFTKSPTCVPVRCQPPDPVKNGSYRKVQKYYPIGATVTFRCKAGYSLVGSDTAICLAVEREGFARFTTSPTCEENNICPDPIDIDNGGITDGKPEYYVGDIVTYYCKAGHWLFPADGTSICINDGVAPSPRFTDPPSCRKIRCEKPSALLNGRFEKAKAFYAIGESVTYYCNVGFVLEGPETSVCLQTEEEAVARFTKPPVCVRIECTPPSPVEYGDYEKKKKRYYVGDFVDYTCTKGYTLKGIARSTCKVRKSGEAMFTKSPQCVELQCARPAFDNGYFVLDQPTYLIGEIITFSCAVGFRLRGPDTAKCTLRPRLNIARFTILPKCIPFVCDPPKKILYGNYRVKQPRYNVGESVTFFCKEGYDLVGNKRATCKLSKDGESVSFSPSPRCNAYRCAKPDKIRYGAFRVVKPYYEIGESITHECDPGFVLIGSETSTCLLIDGENIVKFTKPPTCKRILCNLPLSIEFGDYFEKKPKYRIDDFVTYKCDKGYKIKGDSDRSICVLDPDGKGASFTRPPKCAALQCHKPDPIKYGGYDNDRLYYAVGDIVRYFCDDGYVIKGPKTAKCVKTGDYKAQFTDAPVCIRKLETRCAPPKQFKYGIYEVVKEYYAVGEMIEFFCESGHFLVGPATATCVVGKNSYQARFTKFPSCKPIRCDPPRPILYGDYSEKKRSYMLEEVVVFECGYGYRISGETDSAVCKLNRGGISASFTRPPKCVAVDIRCKPPQGPQNGGYRTIKEYYTIGETVEFFCDYAYRIEGSSIATCESSGGSYVAEFTESATCVEVTCGPPDKPRYGRYEEVKEYYSFGETVEFLCDRGYFIAGLSGIATCVVQGDGSAAFSESPACIPFECNSPAPIQNGDYSEKKPAYSLGDIVVYVCNEGYRIKGKRDSSECILGEFGQSASFTTPPVCVAIDLKCTAPQKPKYGGFRIVKKFYAIGETVEFFCDSGFQLSGLETATCLKVDGLYEAKFEISPVCLELRCGPPDQPKYGRFELVKDYYSIGETVKFFCDSGFHLEGFETAICRKDELLEKASFTISPSCVIVQCGPPETIPNGDYIDKKPAYDLGDIVFYQCDSGYRIKGDGETSICTLHIDGVSAVFTEPPVCVVIRCGPPDIIPHGDYSEKKLSYELGDFVSYQCDDGYRIKGDRDTSVCTLHKDGVSAVFSRPPVCVGLRCRAPQRIDNGGFRIVRKSYAIGDTVDFFCDSGFYMIGAETATCLKADGLYEAEFTTSPVCMEIRCDPPDQPRYGKFEVVKEYYSIGETVEFFCDSGYYIDGSEIATCLKDEELTLALFTSSPICIRIQCSPPTPIDYGDYGEKKLAYYLGDIVVYECNDGYKMSGESDRSVCTLNKNGISASFTKPPACVDLKCQAPERLEYGGFLIVKKSYAIGETVEFFCDSGYWLKGSETAICLQADGIYQAEFTPSPVCVAIQCVAPTPILHGSYILLKSFYNIGEYVIYECDEGYKRNTRRDRSVCRLDPRGDTASFSPTPECVEVRCDPPAQPQYGRFEIAKEYYTLGETVEFFCDTGFELVGSEIATCVERERLVQASFTESPSCNPIQCSPPDSILHGDYIEKKLTYDLGETVTYECDDGYKLKGGDTSICEMHEEYAGFSPPPECVEVQCAPPVRPEYGTYEVVKTFYEIGERVEFFCEEGYRLVGSATSTCLKQKGSYEAEFETSPICEEILCLKPTGIKNGGYEVVKNRYVIGETVGYFCDDGFVIYGAAISTCILNEDFTASFSGKPQCRPIHCKPPPPITSGSYAVQKRRYTVGETIVYECEEGYVIQTAQKTATCTLDSSQKTATFTEAPRCVEIRCSPPKEIEYGDYSVRKEYYSITEEVFYTCNRGYELAFGGTSARCRLNTDGVTASFSDPPQCTEIEVFCRDVADIDNGYYEPKKRIYDVGDIILYTCDTNYKMMGDAASVCTRNEEVYTAEFTRPPRCIPIVCEPPVIVPHATYEPVAKKYTIGEIVLYTCIEGYTISNGRLSTCTLNEDKNSASFSGGTPACERVLCKHPGRLPGGRIVPNKRSYQFSDRIEFICDEGYLLEGAVEAICGSFGIFSAILPVCVELTCPPPIVPDSVAYEPMKRKYNQGEVVGYFCKDPCRAIYGPSKSTCTGSGQFDNQGASCSGMKMCDTHPVVPWYGNIQPFRSNYTCGSVIRFVCHTGSVIVGNKATECLPSGEFSRESPTCEVVRCKAPKLNDKVYITPKYDHPYAYNAKIEYACFWGYRVDGETTAICGENGQFSNKSPRCIPLQCGMPEMPENGGAILNRKTQFDVGDIVFYSCNTYFVMEGEHYNKCNMLGEWEHGPPTCRYPTCVNNCYLHRVEGRPCQCDKDCVEKGDCCSDYESACRGYSCQGRCGSAGSDTECSCHSLCRLPRMARACCKDYFSECEGKWYKTVG